MQTLEAIISFTFFLLFSTYMLAQLDYVKPNYSLYQYQLANDVWRVLYLKGALEDYSSSDSVQNAETIAVMKEIGDETGFCIYLQGTETTNCPSSLSCSEHKLKMKKTWLDGGNADEMEFSVCVPEG